MNHTPAVRPGRRTTLRLPMAAALLLGCAIGSSVAHAQQGLVAHYSFDDINDEFVADSSGNANEATITAGTLVKGVAGAAMGFDGITTTVACRGSEAMDTPGALTLEAWAKLDTTGLAAYPTVVRKEGSYALRFDGNSLGFILWLEGEPEYRVTAHHAWEAGHWYHLVATYDKEQMRVFVDGLEAEGSPQTHTGGFDETVGELFIGSCRGRYALKGAIDEVRIYSRALSADEVEASRQVGLAALRAQAGMTFEPRKVGRAPKQFRKPRRDIAMIEDGFIWVDAEDFADYGGWLLDTQFVHLMGSAYLIAAGIGEPVADATLQIDIPRPGRYRLWVRAKNWLKEHSPGTFAVSVAGTRSEQVFGAADTEDWLWQPGGEFDLQTGTTHIAIHDLTGYYGRCDALILTTDMEYTPPEETQQVREERARLTGISLDVTAGGDFDVIVVGAGAAGGVAALAAARTGARTALIQNRPVLGGNASNELGVPINGAASLHPNARESGIIEELGRLKARYSHPKMSEAFRLAAEAEGNLSVFLNQHVFAVEMQDNANIAAVNAVDTLTNTVTRYAGRMFIDCTGDGWVGYYAGAEYRLGRESKDEFKESLAPEKPDNITMSGCLMGGTSLSYRAADTGQPTPYEPPPWAANLPKADEFGRNPTGFIGGQWWLEHTGDIDDIWQAEKSRDELLRITFGYWDYIKNDWPQRERATNYALAQVPIVEAKRESRRLVGDYMLTQNDVQQARMFPDRISYGGWPLDVHHPRGIFSGKEGPFDCNDHVPIYSIPYRCLYSVNIDNLLFAGRDMSVTHIALGSVRVQGTLAALGQAAGTAAAMALQLDTTPRGLYADHITDLQRRLMKDDQYIPGLPNDDPLDLARQATVKASSSREYDEFGASDVEAEDSHPLNTSRAVMFPRGERETLSALYLLLSSDNPTPTPLTLHVRQASESGEFSETSDLLTAEAAAPPGKQAWIKFSINHDIDAPYFWAWLAPTEGVSWRLMQSAPLGSCRAYGGGQAGEWTLVEGQYYAAYTDPPIAAKAQFTAANAVNGVSRIIGKTPNMWASDPGLPLPQWLELAWDQPTRINTVYLTFDTDMNAPFHTAPLPRQCVRDYELAWHDGAQWVSLAQVKGNYQRRRVHRFDTMTTTRLRLTVHATNGDRSARVFEVRAYEE